MKLVLVLLLCFLSVCFAADEHDFYHKSCPYELKKALENNLDPSRMISELSRDIKGFIIAFPILEASDVDGFIDSIQNISYLISANESIDYSSPEMIEFSEQLLIVAKTFIDKFDKSHIYMLRIIMSTGNSINDGEIRYLISKWLPQLKPVQRIQLLKTFLNIINPESCFVPVTVFEYYKIEKMEIFLENYVEAFVQKIPSNDYQSSFEALFRILKLVTFELDTVEPSAQTFEVLLNALRQSMNMSNIVQNNSLDVILECLASILSLSKLSIGSAVDHVIVDLILDQRITANLSPDTVNNAFLSVIIECLKRDFKYFNSALSSISHSGISTLNIYVDKIRSLNSIKFCAYKLALLNKNSSEADFKFALSCAKKLKLIYMTEQILLRFEPTLSSILNSVTTNTFEVYRDGIHNNYIIGLEVLTHVSLLNFFMSTTHSNRVNSAGNASYGLGRLISASINKSVAYPTDLVKEFTPYINEMTISMLALCKSIQAPISALDLVAYIKFAELHPDKKFTESVNNQLCFCLIVSMPIERIGYGYVRNLDFIDEASVLKAGFFHFFKEHVQNPIASNVAHFEDYFRYLEKKKYFSKSEEAVIKSVFPEF